MNEIADGQDVYVVWDNEAWYKNDILSILLFY